MKKQEKILIEVEKTLQSFDDDIILKENPYLATRLRNEIANRKKRRKKNLVLGISWKQALIFFIILINAITLVSNFERNSDQNIKEQLVFELKKDFQIYQSEDNF